MEYEIDDDPQGLPEWDDGDRDGGLRETPVLYRGREWAPFAPNERYVFLDQPGELANSQ